MVDYENQKKKIVFWSFELLECNCVLPFIKQQKTLLEIQIIIWFQMDQKTK